MDCGSICDSKHNIRGTKKNKIHTPVRALRNSDSTACARTLSLRLERPSRTHVGLDLNARVCTFSSDSKIYGNTISFRLERPWAHCSFYSNTGVCIFEFRLERPRTHISAWTRTPMWAHFSLEPYACARTSIQTLTRARSYLVSSARAHTLSFRLEPVCVNWLV